MTEITDAMVEAAGEVNAWLKATLNNRDWHWDGAQEDAAWFAVRQLDAMLDASAEAARVVDYQNMRDDIKERFPKALEYLAPSPAAPVPAEGKARPGEEYHEDMGDMLWWRFPIDEPPYAGSPLNTDWPGYHTHFTPIPIPTPPEGE
jgi:hypothetical protein